ncbi:MAG: hypothetical protein DWH79_12780 [Planctomycetota bacterium]|nr:MAG: hypothetical protein DWH79_12780 [Planctomycetota bacterium]
MRVVRLSMSFDQVSLGCGEIPSTLRSDEILPSISVRFCVICAESLPLVMKSTGRTITGTSGASNQKWYLATKSQYGRTESGILTIVCPLQLLVWW